MRGARFAVPSIADIRIVGAGRGAVMAPRAGGSAEMRLLVLDDGRRLRVDVEQLTRHGLEAGETIAPHLVAQLAARDAYLRGREFAFRLLAIRSRSVEELRSRLRERVPKAALRSVLNDLVAEGHVDDRAFARAWIANRMVTRPCGAKRLRWELKAKGVAPALIDQAIRDALQEAFPGHEDITAAEQRWALAVARRRLPAYRRLTPDRQARRIAALLQRRGFAPATIIRTLRAVGAGGAMEDLDA